MQDIAFHRHILESAGDRDLVAIWQPIVARMMLQYTRHENMMASYKEHQDILDALKAKDLKKAVAALKHNIQ